MSTQDHEQVRIDNEPFEFENNKKNIDCSILSRTTAETHLVQNSNNDCYAKLVEQDTDNAKFSMLETLKFAPEFYSKSIPLIFNRICPLALNMVSMYFISFYTDPALTAGFGMGHS